MKLPNPFYVPVAPHVARRAQSLVTCITLLSISTTVDTFGVFMWVVLLGHLANTNGSVMVVRFLSVHLAILLTLIFLDLSWDILRFTVHSKWKGPLRIPIIHWLWFDWYVFGSVLSNEWRAHLLLLLMSSFNSFNLVMNNSWRLLISIISQSQIPRSKIANTPVNTDASGRRRGLVSTVG